MHVGQSCIKNMPVCTQSCFCTVQSGYDRAKEEAFVKSILAQTGVVRVLGAKSEQDDTKLLLLIGKHRVILMSFCSDHLFQNGRTTKHIKLSYVWQSYHDRRANAKQMSSPGYIPIFRDLANILNAPVSMLSVHTEQSLITSV